MRTSLIFRHDQSSLTNIRDFEFYENSGNYSAQKNKFEVPCTKLPQLTEKNHEKEKSQSANPQQKDHLENTSHLQPTSTIDTVTDLVFLVDGSDSFNKLITGSIQYKKWFLHCKTLDSRFETTYHQVLRSLIDDFLPWIPEFLPNHTATLIQFSGIAQLESSYEPGSFGKTQIEGCNMYNIELETRCLDRNSSFDDIFNRSG